MCQLLLSHRTAIVYLCHWFCNLNPLDNLICVNILGVWSSGPGLKAILAFVVLVLFPSVVATMDLTGISLGHSFKVRISGSYLMSAYYMPDAVHISPCLMLTMKKH